jgi:hypothetical protein
VVRRPGDRDIQDYSRSTSGTRPHDQRASHQARAFPHAYDAEPVSSRARIEPASIISDRELDAAWCSGQGDFDVARPRVSSNIRERFGCDAEQLFLDLGWYRCPSLRTYADAHAGFCRQLVSERRERHGQRSTLQRRPTQLAERAASFLEIGTRDAQRSLQFRARRARRDVGQRGFDVEADRCQTLRQRVVQIAAEAGTLFDARQTDALVSEPCALDRDADLRGDRREQIELPAGQFPPGRRGDVHDAEASIPEVQRDARVIAEPAGRTAIRGERGAQAAALDDVDVFSCQLAGSIRVDAPARPAGHAYRIAQERRKIPGGRAVEAVGPRIDQPDPAGAQVEQIGDSGQRVTERPIDVSRAVERFGNLLENPEITRARARPLPIA